MDSPASLSQHWGELRGRALWALALWAGASAVAGVFAAEIYAFLLRPLAGAGASHGLIYTGVAEVLVTYIRVALWAGAFVGAPALLVQIFRFAAPGLTPAERRSAWPLLVLAPALFMAGVAFVYFAVLPAAMPFFVGFERAGGPLPIAMQLRTAEYLDFVLTLTFAFGAVFQLPLALILAVRTGLLDPATLRGKRRWVIVGAAALAAVLTPPDVVSQLLLAGAVVALYEATLLFLRSPRGAGAPQSPQAPPGQRE